MSVLLSVFQENNFLAAQKNYLDTTLKRIISNNKREIAEKERECLNKKHHLIRGTVSAAHGLHLKPKVSLFLTTSAVKGCYMCCNCGSLLSVQSVKL